MLTTARVLLCFATALLVAATAYLCAWLTVGNAESIPNATPLTRRSLDLLRQEIEAHKERTGEWPARLTDLKIVWDKQLPTNPEGNPVDMWGRPIQYRIEGDGYQLYSYGEDGPQENGSESGYLFVGKPDPRIERLPFWEYTTSSKARRAQIICALAGLIAFPLCLLHAKGQRDSAPALVPFLLRIGVTAMFAAFAALVISVIQAMPGGH